MAPLPSMFDTKCARNLIIHALSKVTPYSNYEHQKRQHGSLMLTIRHHHSFLIRGLMQIKLILQGCETRKHKIER